jgi:hypothetical protein
MRKITSFTIAAIALGVAIIFCAWSSVVATSPDMLRPQAGMPYGAAVDSFLPSGSNRLGSANQPVTAAAKCRPMRTWSSWRAFA